MEFTNPIKRGHLGEVYLFFILLISNIAAFFADKYWILELFTHFRLQYFIGAGFVVLLLMFSRNWLLVFFTLLIGCYNFYEVSRYSNQAEIYNKKIVLYHHNVLVTNNNLDILTYNLIKEPYDVVILQEATPNLIPYLEKLKKRYPHVINRTQFGVFGTLILSRYKIKEEKILTLKHGTFENEAIRFTIEHPDFNDDIAIYTVHTPTPTGKNIQKWRDAELIDLALTIDIDKSKYKIFSGDWNITPYSPVFKEIMDKSGLIYHASDKYAEGTWPAPFQFKVFQIPIDHIMSTRNLVVDVDVMEDSFGSDHYPLVGTIKIRDY